MQVLNSILKGLSRLFLQPIFLLLLLVVVSSGGIYFFTQYKTISSEISRLRGDPTANAEKEIDDLLAKVGELTELPVDERPTVATVTDKEAVSEQAFFRSAENGDRVLIYTEARRAILYRPSTNKVIEIAPVNIGNNQAGDTQVDGDEESFEGEERRTVNIAIFNSTAIAGLNDRAYDQLVSDFPELDIVSDNRQDTGGNYENSVVVVLNSDFAQEGQDIANAIGTATGDLPEGLIAPVTDLLLVLGNDYAN